MANTTIKITQLPSIGNNLTAGTVLPVVAVNGITPTTDKTTVGNIANFTLTNAGNTLPPALLSIYSQTVTNAAQPNITSVGTLSVNTLKISGGVNGYVLQTDGAGNLSWTAQTGNSGNGLVGGANTQVQFNDAGDFGGNAGFTFNKTSGVFTSPFLAGNGNGLSNIQGANVSGAVSFAGTANSVAVANVVGLGNIATVALNGNGSQYLRGNGTWGNGSGGANTGDINFTANAMYNLGGIIVENADLTHGATSALILPINGNSAAPVQLTNTYGNIVVTTGINSGQLKNWTFDNTGNLTLPANTFAVNYANGTPVSIGGGSGNTGNVTFDNNIVIGTGSQDGYLGLYLAIGPDSVANSQYLQVRGGDNLTHIHLDTGDNTYFDQYFGDDGKYLKLTAGSAGNIVIGTDTNAWNWTFDSEGNLTVPGNIQSVTTGFPFTSTITGITTGNPTVIVTIADSPFPGPVTGQVTITDVVGTVEANNTWYFEATENNEFQLYYDQALTSPVDGDIWTTYVSGGSAAALGFNDLSITGGSLQLINNTGLSWTFDNTGALTIPSGDSTIINQGQIFSGNESSFINLDVQFGSNVLGGVRLGTSGPQPVDIMTGDGSGGNNIWRFDSSGGTIFPTLNVQRGDNPSGTITGQTLLFGDATQEAIISTPDGVDDFNSSAQRLVINPGKGADDTLGEGGDIYLWAGRGGSGSGSGGDIKIRGGQGGSNVGGGSGGDGGYIRMEAGDADSSGGAAGYIQITGGVAGYVTPGIAGGFVTITGGQGQNGDGGITTIQGGYGGTGYHGGNVQINGGGTSSGQSSEGNVNIQTGGNTWTFGPTGIVTLPDSTIMGAVEGTGTFGFYNANANTAFLIELGPTNAWSFNGASGITGLPNNTLKTGANLVIETPNGVPSSTANISSQGGYNIGTYTGLATTGGSGTGLTVNANSTGGYIGTVTINTPGSGYTDGDTITIVGGDGLGCTFTIGVSVNSWNFNTAGNITLPTISLGSGVDEQAVISSQRKLIPPLRYSAVIDGTTPTIVYTATNVDTTSMKVTMQIQHTGLGMEFFEVFATFTGADTYYTVGNRVAPPTIDASTVVVGLTGSNAMKITVTINSGAATSWVTYDATEFGIAVD